MICTAAKSIQIGVGACPDWTHLIEPNTPGYPSIIQGGGTTVTWSPMAGDMHSFAGTIVYDGVHQAQMFSDAKLANYNLGGCNCNFHAVWNINSYAELHQASVFANKSTGGSLFSVNFTNMASNTYDFPFSLPSGVVLPYDIIVSVTLSVSPTFFNPITFSLSGLITNV